MENAPEGTFIEVNGVEDDESWGWADYSPTSVHHLSGDHLSILNQPHVDELATRLNEAFALVDVNLREALVDQADEIQDYADQQMPVMSE